MAGREQGGDVIRSLASLAILSTALLLLPVAAGVAVLEINLTEGLARRRSRARAERVAERGGRRSAQPRRPCLHPLVGAPTP
jgi:hypothetical protein